MERYCFYLSLRNPTFVVSDLIATSQNLNIPFEFEDKNLKIGVSPECFFTVLLFPTDEDAILFSKASTVTKYAMKLIYDCEKFDELIEFTNGYEHSFNDGTFRISIDSYGRKISKEDRLSYINRLIPSLRITSKVDLHNPSNELMLLVRRIPEQESTIKTERFYFGTKLCDGNFTFPDKFNLKQRKFINKTSMESSVALLACNQGLCNKGKIMFDPFCGSGSLLIAGASMGAHVLGSDFDIKSMTQQGHKQKEDVSIPANFAQYGLTEKFIGLIRMDFMSEHLRYDTMPKLDCIVTDPPYGIREKIRADATTPLLPLLLRLYAVSARVLKLGGRLVYWIPTGYDFDNEKDLPKQKALRLISDSQQDLMSRYCRHLITLEKISDKEEDINSPVEFLEADQSFLKVRDLVFSSRSNPDGFLRKETRKDRKKARRQAAKEMKEKEKEAEKEEK